MKLKNDIQKVRNTIHNGNERVTQLKKNVDELLHQQVQIEMEMADVEEAVDRRQENVQNLREWYQKATTILSSMFGIKINYEKTGLLVFYTMPDTTSKIQVNIKIDSISGGIESVQVKKIYAYLMIIR